MSGVAPPITTESTEFTTQLTVALHQLVFDGVPSSTAYAVLGDVISNFWGQSATQSSLRELYNLMLQGGVLPRMMNLGTRSAVANISPSGIVRMLAGTNIPLGTEASRILVRLRKMFDSAMDVRNDPTLRKISTYDGEAMFTYRTSEGALWPRGPSVEDADKIQSMLHTKSESGDEVTVGSTFTKSIEKIKIMPTSKLTDSEYSTLSKGEAAKLLKGEEFEFDVNVHANHEIGKGRHILERITDYNISAGIDNVIGMLSKLKCKGKISDGRNVLRQEKEDTKDVRDSYLLTFALDTKLPCRMVMDVNQTTLDVKTIASGYATPYIKGRKCTFSEYIDSDVRDPIKLKVTFVVTIIPSETSMPVSTLMTTGFPVVPAFVDDIHIEPFVQDIGADTMLPRGVLSNMNESLRNTDQWTNLPHNTFKTSDGRFLTNRVDFPDIVQVTKFGVEFEDVEYIRDNYPGVYQLVYDIGIKFLSNVSGAPVSVSHNWWNRVKVGPSITHSQVIRTHASPFSGTKPFNRKDLLVRYVLSRMFSVGQGNVIDTQLNSSAQSVRLPHSVHLLNPKRAEALMLPLCVTSVGMIVYSLSSGLARLLDRVHLNMPEFKDSYLKEFYTLNVPKERGTRSRVPTARVDDVDERPLFITRATPLQVVERGAPLNSRFTIVMPSGVEFSVSSIISDIAYQMMNHKTISKRNENAVLWHPNFAVIVSQTVRKVGTLGVRRTYHAIVLPAVRKSRVAPPFRNVDSAVRDSVTNRNQLVHYARLTESFGYIGGLLRALPFIKSRMQN